MKKIAILALFSLLSLASCNEGSPSSLSSSVESSISTSTSTSASSSTPVTEDKTKATIRIDASEEGETYTPEEVTITETLHSLEEKKYYNTRVLPSTGEVNLLVIPVLIPGYTSFGYAHLEEGLEQSEKEEIVRSDIEKAFFGEGEDIGYESLASFYRKSSFGKLELTGFVTDWYDATSAGITAATQLTTSTIYSFVERAVNWAFNTYGLHPKDYDSDGDGFYDGVWLVYSAEDYTRNGPMTDDMNYWAYTSWGNQDKTPDPDHNDYFYNLFGWASYDFLYESYEDALDSHTFIHETGHFLGLNDYYSDRLMYNPVGKVNMMDANITDLDSYSKMLLGWTKPYLVTGSDEIDLETMEEENNVIVVPSDSYAGGNAFDPFSEYLLLELYTPTSLNEKDSQQALSEDRPIAPAEIGVRIYHVDNRKFVTSRTGQDTREYLPGEELGTGEKFLTPITNSITPDQYYYYNNLDISYYPYDEIRLIEASGKNTFSYGGYQTAESYFQAGDSFSIEDYDEFFLKSTFDNGESFTKRIDILELTEVQ